MHQRLELFRQRCKAAGKGHASIGPDLPIREMDQPVTLRLDQAPAGDSEARIQAENSQARRSSSSSGTS